MDGGVPLRQLTDYGTHEAIYVPDPDDNDLELAWDRPFDQWPASGDMKYLDMPLELEDLLAARA